MRRSVSSRFLSSAALLILFQPVQGQESKEAESLFKKTADRVIGAKSVTIVCSGQFKTAGFEANVKASLLMKEGNKMRMEVAVDGVRDGAPHAYSITVVSNGTTFRMRENQGGWIEYVTTSNWNELAALNIVRGGFPSGLELARFKKQGEKEASAMAFRPVAPPVDYSSCAKDRVAGREAVPIEFRVKSDLDFAKEISSILWLDPATGLPLQRLNVIRTDRTLTVTESYQKFLLNERLDDASFVLPKE